MGLVMSNRAKDGDNTSSSCTDYQHSATKQH